MQPRVRTARSSQSQPAVRPNREPLARRDRGGRAAPWCGAPFGTAPRRRAAREPRNGGASLSRPGDRRVRRNAPGRGDVRARGPARRPGPRARPAGHYPRSPDAGRSRTPRRVPGRAAGGDRGTDRSRNSMTNAIEIRQLHYRAGRAFQLKELDLTVPSGAIYGFLGPNGSGKTTTIRLVLGLLRPLEGRIPVLGDAIPDAAPRVLARVGYVPEQPHLDPTLTVRETLRFQAAFYPHWDSPCAERLLRQFELDERTAFGRLSKGQKGKLMTLLALAQRPDLLVLDEPTDGLDPVVRRDVLSALLDYVSQRRATVFISRHLVPELERLSDWVGVLATGRLTPQGPLGGFMTA